VVYDQFERRRVECPERNEVKPQSKLYFAKLAYGFQPFEHALQIRQLIL
jgi:hypothetical protein